MPFRYYYPPSSCSHNDRYRRVAVIALTVAFTSGPSSAFEHVRSTPGSGTAVFTACGPECTSPCFDGHCLFGGTGVEEELAADDGVFGKMQRAVSAPLVMEEHLNPIAPRHVFRPPVALAAAPPQLQDSGALAVASPAFGISSQQPYMTPLLDLLPIAKPPLTDAQLFNTETALANPPDRAGEMQQALEAAEAEKSRLLQDNSQLKREVDSWRAVGEHVATRQARVGGLLESVAQVEPGAAADSQVIALVATESMSAEEQAEHSIRAAPHHIVLITEVCIFVLAACLACSFHEQLLQSLLGRGRKKKGIESAAPLARKAARYPPQVSKTPQAGLQIMQPMSRWLGTAHYVVEVSELYFGNAGSLLLGDKVFIRIDMGLNQPLVTQSATSTEDSFIAFSETFRLNVRKIDGPCLLSVVDSAVPTPNRVAHVEIPTAQLLQMAMQRQHYFRFPLKLDGQRRWLLKGDYNADWPYLALGIRDLTSELNSPQSLESRVCEC